MERSAVYRRALAPVMTVTGMIGMGAAFAGWKAGVSAPGTFILYWLGVAVVALLASLLLVRRQALQTGEPFWSPPTRRVSQAVVPELFAGVVVGAAAAIGGWQADDWQSPAYFSNVCVPLVWVILYGCAVHSAGFFMKRGIRRFGWNVMVCGCIGFLLHEPDTPAGLADRGYLIMGIVFGLLHVAYGIYLFATEKRTLSE